MEHNEKLIDIRKVIGDKNPNLLKIFITSSMPHTIPFCLE